ncbi:hypothetical protein [Arundinibacter roseus]|uniref:Transposase IS200-like domain-containing protein n=1 Tax=Arundinibacter roseus TaxID=2070510 RepID=A0A4R4JS50_9BACT|nr:hypothetical protein [Arundinibacter roseus]TDB57358.1 hypothetical protein EZE20_23570 [Arundinibacter roseus]
MKKYTFQPQAYYHISRRVAENAVLFREHDDYIHFLFLYCRQVQPIARTFAYCLLPDSFHLLIQFRDIAALNRHLEKTGEAPDLLEESCCNYLENQLDAFVENYEKSIPAHEYVSAAERLTAEWRCEEIADAVLAAQFVHLLHLFPAYHLQIQPDTFWPYSSLHSLKSDRHTFVERDIVHRWFGGREAFIRDASQVQVEIS